MTMREEFEVFARRCFECSEYSFEKDNGVYFNHVGRQTFGGRRTSDFSSVQMLWETWQACAAAATAAEREQCAKVCEGIEMKEYSRYNDAGRDVASDCAAAIRGND